MSVRKFFQWTSHNCLKVFKNWSTSIQNRRQRKKYTSYGSAISLSNYGYRGSISTEVTILEDLHLCSCQANNNEVNENRLNECIEQRGDY
ncbi:unnamed protein product [Phyllotreta striolata]|uniref:Uncharacterized protein n=1 Tax=Phyllotreta striolata TaxID=444603 RepID=A0A9N9XIS0_PHYSR|nr:unnamed protein product [Phyllotreta striolata]